MKTAKKMFIAVGLSVITLLGALGITLAPVNAATEKLSNNGPLEFVQEGKNVTIEGKVFGIDKIPVIKEGEENAVEIKDLDVYKEIIDGKVMLHVFSVKPVTELGYSVQDVYHSYAYGINDYYDGTYMGTAELDTTWYTSGGNVTGITN
ncbi:MAG: hypothetical protein WA125_08350 [Desulfosporosinus sp.]